MHQRNFKLFFAVLALAVASLACQLAFSTANVENLRVTQDEAGEQTTAQFEPEDTFYLVGDLSNAPDDTKIKAVWTAVEVEGADPNTVIEERELTAPSGPFWFSLSQDSGIWPAADIRSSFSWTTSSTRAWSFRWWHPRANSSAYGSRRSPRLLRRQRRQPNQPAWSDAFTALMSKANNPPLPLPGG
jgi:hypothetical protein